MRGAHTALIGLFTQSGSFPRPLVVPPCCFCRRGGFLLTSGNEKGVPFLKTKLSKADLLTFTCVQFDSRSQKVNLLFPRPLGNFVACCLDVMTFLKLLPHEFCFHSTHQGLFTSSRASQKASPMSSDQHVLKKKPPEKEARARKKKTFWKTLLKEKARFLARVLQNGGEKPKKNSRRAAPSPPRPSSSEGLAAPRGGHRAGGVRRVRRSVGASMRRAGGVFLLT